MQRGLLLLLAVAGSAFFALSAYQATSTDAARERLQSPDRPTPAAARRTEDLLDHAGTLNPSAEVDVLRAQLALTQRDTATARRLLLGVVDREPAYLEAWAILSVLVKDDPVLFERARRTVERYSPPVPEP